MADYGLFGGSYLAPSLFCQFLNGKGEFLIIDRFGRKDDKCIYITQGSVNKIHNHLKMIISNIEKKIEFINELVIKQYLESLKIVAKYVLKTQQSNDIFNITVLSKDLETLSVCKHKSSQILSVHLGMFAIGFAKQLDYLTHQDELKELLLKSKIEEPIEEPKEDPKDEAILTERRKSVLEFDHPEGFIDEDGNYQYDYMDIREPSVYYTEEGFHILEEAARMYRLRAKSRQHFANLGKIHYDYQEMKQNHKPLHAEMKTFHKVFIKLLRMQYAPVAIMVNDK